MFPSSPNFDEEPYKRNYCQECGKELPSTGYITPTLCKECRRKKIANSDWGSRIKL